MPEPGITDRNFNDPTSDRQNPRRRKSRSRLQIPGEYAEFRLEDGRFLVVIYPFAGRRISRNEIEFPSADEPGHE